MKLLKQGCWHLKKLFETYAHFKPFTKITIASACNFDLRMNRVQPIAIASEPLHGWRLSKNQSNTRLVRIWKSKTGSRGVESIESWRTRCIMDLTSGPDYPLHPPQIHHAGNQGERRIEETHYIVDGYDASTRTVHEIHGCFWYGCTTCYKNRTQEHLMCAKTTCDLLQPVFV